MSDVAEDTRHVVITVIKHIAKMFPGDAMIGEWTFGKTWAIYLAAVKNC